MVPLVTELAPERWKVFQVLPMGGQNDGAVDPLLISDAEFEAWCQHHAVVEEVAGVPFVAETNEEMLGSYAMLDALCRWVSWWVWVAAGTMTGAGAGISMLRGLLGGGGIGMNVAQIAAPGCSCHSSPCP